MGLEKKISETLYKEKNIVFLTIYKPVSKQTLSDVVTEHQKSSSIIIYLLFDKVFNQKKVSSFEKELREKSCYFLDQAGQVYDQFEIFFNEKRMYRGRPLSIDMRQLVPFSPFLKKNLFPAILHNRIENHPFYCKGDLMDRACNHPFYLEKLLLWEKTLACQKTFSIKQRIRKLHAIFIKRALLSLAKSDFPL